MKREEFVPRVKQLLKELSESTGFDYYNELVVSDVYEEEMHIGLDEDGCIVINDMRVFFHVEELTDIYTEVYQDNPGFELLIFKFGKNEIRCVILHGEIILFLDGKDYYGVSAYVLLGALDSGELMLEDLDKDFVRVNDILLKYNGEEKEVTIPEGIKIVFDNCFFSNYYVERIICSDSVKLIGTRAFANCLNLVSADLNQVEVLEGQAFSGCKKLKEVKIPETLAKIGADVFAGTAIENEMGMSKEEFIKKCQEYLETTGMTEIYRHYDGKNEVWYLTIGDEEDMNTNLYVDDEGALWVSYEDSVKRVKTKINVNKVTEFRYSKYDEEPSLFFVYCKHKNVSDMRELSCLRRSKYVQSEINYSYRKVKKDLESNKKVLFLGSPCQIAGLFSYLRKRYSNLYTVEFICLGVNSPLVYRKWIDEIEEKYKKVVKDIWFKYKTEGWRESPMHTLIEFEDGSTILLDDKSNYYMKGYLNGGYYVRKSCSDCKFMKDKRYADIVIGDYWDVEKSVDDGKGTSIVLTLSSNGEELFNKLKCRLNYYPIEVESISVGNPRFTEPAPYNPKSEEFFRELKTSRFSDLMKRFIAEDNSEPEIMSRIKKGKDN